MHSRPHLALSQLLARFHLCCQTSLMLRQIELNVPMGNMALDYVSAPAQRFP